MLGSSSWDLLLTHHKGLFLFSSLQMITRIIRNISNLSQPPVLYEAVLVESLLPTSATFITKSLAPKKLRSPNAPEFFGTKRSLHDNSGRKVKLFSPPIRNYRASPNSRRPFSCVKRIKSPGEKFWRDTLRRGFLFLFLSGSALPCPGPCPCPCPWLSRTFCALRCQPTYGLVPPNTRVLPIFPHCMILKSDSHHLIQFVPWYQE